MPTITVTRLVAIHYLCVTLTYDSLNGDFSLVCWMVILNVCRQVQQHDTATEWVWGRYRGSARGKEAKPRMLTPRERRKKRPKKKKGGFLKLLRVYLIFSWIKSNYRGGMCAASTVCSNSMQIVVDLRVLEAIVNINAADCRFWSSPVRIHHVFF